MDRKQFSSNLYFESRWEFSRIIFAMCSLALSRCNENAFLENTEHRIQTFGLKAYSTITLNSDSGTDKSAHLLSEEVKSSHPQRQFDLK